MGKMAKRKAASALEHRKRQLKKHVTHSIHDLKGVVK